MKKIERVNCVLRGTAPDQPPMGFWLHFPKEVISKGVEAQAAAHLAFKDETQTDILKIMNENEMRSTQKLSSFMNGKILRSFPRIPSWLPIKRISYDEL